MPDVPTFQDLISDFSAEVFVGRSEQLALFEKGLTASRPPFLILDVSGQGGVGKTTLLEQFRRVAKNHEVLTALANEDQTSVPATIAHLAHQFGEAGHPFKTFDERYRKYRELKEQVEADPKAPTGLLDFALRSATKIGLRSLRRVPIAGEAADVLLTPEAEDVIADQTSAFATYVGQKFANKDEKVLLLETDAELTRHFLTDLNKHAQSNRIVFFFDTYERTSVYLDAWLLDLLEGKFGTFSGSILFVIAGRYQLGQVWTRFRKAIRQIELHEFTEVEAREYLARSGITDEVQIAQAFRLSNRLPVLLALLVSAPGDLPSDVSGNAVERFLKGATSEQRDAALVASVPRLFNQDILAVILAPEAASAAFEWLSQAAFVRSSIQGWTYHEVVRSMMVRYLRMRSGQQSEELHSKMAEYYLGQIERLDIPQGAQHQSEVSHDLEVERLYHNFSQSPSAGLVETMAVLLDVLPSFSSETYARDREMLQDLVRVLHQVSTEVDNAELKRSAVQLQRLVSLSDKNEFDDELKRFIREAKESIAEYYFDRGHMSREKGDFDAALGNFIKAIELQPDHGASLYERGQLYREMQNYTLALADFSRLVAMDPETVLNYYSRGKTYLEIADYPAALADFTKAIELQPKIGEGYYLRGLVYQEMKEYSAAVADFIRWSDLQPQPQTMVDELSRTIESHPESNVVYYLRGRAYWTVKAYVAAHFDFSRAIELRFDFADCFFLRGRVFLEMRDYPSALKDFSQAIALALNIDVYYFWRGFAHYAVGNHSAALEDFTKAIELQPSDAYNYAWRGRTHLSLNDVTSAQVDFVQVGKLLGKERYPAYIVAASYANKGQAAEACLWLRLFLQKDRTLAAEVLVDPGFEPVRTSPEFQALLAEFEESDLGGA